MSLTDKQRSALVSNALWLYSFGDRIGYAQKRPFELRSKATLTSMFSKGETVDDWDCSAFTIETCFLAGVKDPSGFNFNGDGNSQSMLDHLSHYSNAIDAHPGALVVFGADLPLADQHVCMVVEQGKNPMLISHGAPGVKELTLSQEQTAHTGTTVFLDVSSL